MTNKEIDKSIRDEIKQDFKVRQERHQQIEEMARSCCSRTYKTCKECIKESEKVFGKTDIDDCECYSYARRFCNKGYHKTIWHKVADGDLPKKYKEVLFLDENYEYYIGSYAKDEESFHTDIGFDMGKNKVIAWTELPKYGE